LAIRFFSTFESSLQVICGIDTSIMQYTVYIASVSGLDVKNIGGSFS
jgi:hypothetical protein